MNESERKSGHEAELGDNAVSPNEIILPSFCQFRHVQLHLRPPPTLGTSAILTLALTLTPTLALILTHPFY